MAPGEIDDILAKRTKLLAERDLHKQGKQVRESSNKGDHELALEVLENLIAQNENGIEENMTKEKKFQLLMFKLRSLFVIIKRRNSY